MEIPTELHPCLSKIIVFYNALPRYILISKIYTLEVRILFPLLYYKPVKGKNLITDLCSQSKPITGAEKKSVKYPLISVYGVLVF